MPCPAGLTQQRLSLHVLTAFGMTTKPCPLRRIIAYENKQSLISPNVINKCGIKKQRWNHSVDALLARILYSTRTEHRSSIKISLRRLGHS